MAIVMSNLMIKLNNGNKETCMDPDLLEGGNVNEKRRRSQEIHILFINIMKYFATLNSALKCDIRKHCTSVMYTYV